MSKLLEGDGDALMLMRRLVEKKEAAACCDTSKSRVEVDCDEEMTLDVWKWITDARSVRAQQRAVAAASPTVPTTTSATASPTASTLADRQVIV